MSVDFPPSRRPLRAHAITPLPAAALGAGLAAMPGLVAGQAVDDSYQALLRGDHHVSALLGNVLANDGAGNTSVVTYSGTLAGALLIADGRLFYGARGSDCDNPRPAVVAYQTNTGAQAIATIELLAASVPDTVRVPAGTSLEFNVQQNDPLFAVPNLLAVAAFTTPADGTLTQLEPGVAQRTGRFRYDAPTATGTRTFGYQIDDPSIPCNNVFTSVALVVVPNPPSLALDTGHATEVCSTPLAGVPDAGGLSVVAVGAASRGTTRRDGDQVCYLPATGFRGSDTFSYVVEDGFGEQGTGSITVSVANAPPQAVPDSASGRTPDPLTGNVLANDLDANNDPLTAVTTSPPANGALVLQTGGGFVYTPAPGFSGDDSFQYAARDGIDNTIATVTLAVLPRAQDDAFVTAYLTAVSSNVVANDLGSNLSAALSRAPLRGTLSLAADGGFTYSPAAGFSGADSFGYTLVDGAGRSHTANVAITVGNAPPQGANDLFTTAAGQPVSGNVLANDGDPNGQPLSVISSTAPANGTATLAGDGQFTYTPAAGFSGDDSLQYRASDGIDNVVATVSLVVQPRAIDDSVNTAYLQGVSGNVLANDLGNGLTVVAASAAASGAASVAPDGAFTYTPASAFSGSDSFTYTLRDSAGREQTARVTIAVGNAAPVAQDDLLTTVAGQAVSANLLANDSDPNGQPLSVVGNTQPSDGSVSVSSAGALVYTPAAGFSGNDRFTYTVTDGAGGTASAAVDLQVAPRALADAATTPLATAVSGNVLANDLGRGLAVSATTTPANGSASVSPTGSFTYTPNAAFTGSDSFDYTLTDAAGRSASARVTVQVGLGGVTLDVIGARNRAALLGAPFADPLTVRLQANGAPLAGQRVCFAVLAATSGASATLSASEALTDGNGEARVTAIANGIAGTYAVEVRLCDQPTVLTGFSLSNAGPALPIPAANPSLLGLLAGLLGWFGWRRRRRSD